MVVDIKTLMTCNLGIAFIFFITFLSYLKNKNPPNGFRVWTFGIITHTLGFVFLVFRGTIPIGICIVFTNLLITFSVVFRLDAISRFVQNKALRKSLYSFPVFVTIVCSCFYFLNDDIGIRNIITSTFVFLFTIAISWQLIRYAPPLNTILYYLMAFGVTIRGGTLMYRAILWLIDPKVSHFDANNNNAIHFFIAILSEIGINVLFLMMNNQKAENKILQTNKELQEALDNVRTLKGLIPICSHCKKIRDDKGYWNILESYIQKHSDASFSHGLCPDCSDKLYGNNDWYLKMKKKKEAM